MTTPNANNTTIIGPDAHFKGELTFEGTAKVLGIFDGTITTKGETAVGTGATCNADIHAARVVVDGTVNGDLTGDELIELNAGAKIKGDITAGNLVVVEGASFEGHVRVGAGMSVKKAPEAEAKPAPATPTAAASATTKADNRPQVQTRSMRPASTVSETAAAPSAASAAVARATSDAANASSSWLKGEQKDEQNAA